MRIKGSWCCVLGLSVWLLGVSASSYAGSDPSSAELARQMRLISRQTNALQQEVRHLRAQLHALKAQKAAVHHHHQAHPREQHRSYASKSHIRAYIPVRNHVATDDPSKVPAPRSHIEEVLNFPTVMTSPWVGLRSEYDAQDLVINLSSMNEDLRLLEQQKRFLERIGDPEYYDRRPVLELSGKVEGQYFSRHDFDGSHPNEIDLSGAEIDILAEVSRWAYGFMSIAYNNNRLDPVLLGSGQRIGNSNIFLKRGWVTIGDLERSPVYFSIGQMFVDFGRYSSMMISSPMTLVIGRTNVRAANFGFSHNNFYASGYLFRGDTHTGNPNKLSQGGGNVGYTFHVGHLETTLGAGVIANLADAAGMQITGAPRGQFQGFGVGAATEQLVRRVPGVDVHGKFSFAPFSLTTEYVAATRSFDQQNLAYNMQGAKPRAFHIELAYRFKVWDKPTAFGVAFDRSWEALALSLPKKSYFAILSTSLWKNTIESIEYRHDTNYAQTDTAGGQCVVNGVLQFCPVPVFGRSRDTFLAQIGVYF